MKKQILAVVAVLALSAGSAYAAAVTAGPREGVVGSEHDMRTKAGLTETQDRVCVYCHTPHHADTSAAALKAPLWSRGSNGSTYVAYASSTFTVAGSDPAVGTTRLCLSCHDASLALDNYYGSGKTIAGGGTEIDAADTYGHPNIGAGQTLNNDHPVGMDLLALGCATSPTDNTSSTPGNASCGTWAYIRNLTDSLNAVPYLGNGRGVTVNERLFDDGTHLYMTCATCHDVHNKKNEDLAAGGQNYFVLAPQAGSKLCITCHIK